MIYRITATFDSTESAQRAAKRISSIDGEVYEVRLDYRVDMENDNVIYSHKGNVGMPIGGVVNEFHNNLLNRLDDIPHGEWPDGCYMAVFCEDKLNETVSGAIINSGGYDITVSEEKLL